MINSQQVLWINHQTTCWISCTEITMIKESLNHLSQLLSMIKNRILTFSNKFQYKVPKNNKVSNSHFSPWWFKKEVNWPNKDCSLNKTNPIKFSIRDILCHNLINTEHHKKLRRACRRVCRCLELASAVWQPVRNMEITIVPNLIMKVWIRLSCNLNQLIQEVRWWATPKWKGPRQNSKISVIWWEKTRVEECPGNQQKRRWFRDIILTK
jgi:hypothetical protein